MTKVYAVRVHQLGGPEQLRYEQVEVGEPGRGEASVRHTAIGLNFTDIHFRTGRYPLPSLPHVIGMEAAGVIEAIGDGVTAFRPGDRVAYAAATPGAYAQAAVMPASRLIKLPDFIDDEAAAATLLKGLTAQYLIRGAYTIKQGETILVQAAAGGVGLIICQWARHLGTRVVGTVSTPEKAALAKANGCSDPIIYTREDVVARVRELSGGAGLPVVYDGVGGSTYETSLQCLKRRGLAVFYGSAGGIIPPFDLWRLNRMGSLYVTYAGLADYLHDHVEMDERAAELFAMMRNGVVKVPIHKRYRLADASQAHADLEGRRTSGASLLIP
ncbi:quinone oxidoreductase [Bradyrhizobium sp.]|uniref:quinone oxidoreductase family protein n=1 Tax=Bradyrhizobium sp. TaxID=376 RepID=UPI00262C63A0|nr:quinone oxidoreductase [Bradyrhizobium sp.]